MRKRRNLNKFTISTMYCCRCGKRSFDIPRPASRYREPGHLKTLYCPHCKRKWNHVEIRSIFGDYNYEDFLLEMKYNNFDEHGKRKEPYKTLREKIEQKELMKK